MSGIAERNAWKAFMNHLNVCAGGSKGAGPRKPVWVIDKITAHMLRHTYATMLFDAGVDVKSAQRFLGHISVIVQLCVHDCEAESACYLVNADWNRILRGTRIYHFLVVIVGCMLARNGQ